jgi:hypothetical protein
MIESNPACPGKGCQRFKIFECRKPPTFRTGVFSSGIREQTVQIDRSPPDSGYGDGHFVFTRSRINYRAYILQNAGNIPSVRNVFIIYLS